MASVVSDKPINVSQLGVEMGRIPLQVVGPFPDGTTRVTVDVDDATLQAAIAAHTADPNWTSPDPVPLEQQEASTREDRLTELRAKAANGLTVSEVVEAVTLALETGRL